MCKVRTVCLEKTYPQAIEVIQEIGDGPIIYADLGSPHLSLISKVNKGRREILVLDHHDMEPLEDPTITVLNPEVYGVDGGVYACGASLAYFFSKSIKPSTPSLAHLAVIGSVEIPGEPKGLNMEVLNEAIKAGVATYDKARGKRSVTWDGRSVSPESISTKLNILASVGYYGEGPQKAVDACIKSSWIGVEGYLKQLEQERKKAYSSVMAKLHQEGFRKAKHVQWFHVEDAFYNMGVKVIGTFCSYLMHQRLVDEDKVLVGFMNMRPDIPGIGKLKGDLVKVSARAPRRVVSMIELGAMEPLSKLLPKAAEKVGGFGDGHAAAASGVIPKGRERDFISFMDEYAKKERVKEERRGATLMDFLSPKKVKQ
ncbi:MAG: hypothetical protein DRJ62_03045 [Thermoprotei archaeon]|nr:MAG: hypothetical protein DRJ62_03045 [Thermoprotei archaeon]